MTDTIRTAALLLPTVVAIAAIAVAVRWRGKAEEEAARADRAARALTGAHEVQADLRREINRTAEIARRLRDEANDLRQEKRQLLTAKAIEIKVYAVDRDQVRRAPEASGMGVLELSKVAGAAWEEAEVEKHTAAVRVHHGRFGIEPIALAEPYGEAMLRDLTENTVRQIWGSVLEAAQEIRREAGVG